MLNIKEHELWKISGESHGNYIAITALPRHGGKLKQVVKVNWGGEDDRVTDFDRAKLVAAAPDMQEALQKVADSLHKTEGTMTPQIQYLYDLANNVLKQTR